MKMFGVTMNHGSSATEAHCDSDIPKETSSDYSITDGQQFRSVNFFVTLLSSFDPASRHECQLHLKPSLLHHPRKTCCFLQSCSTSLLPGSHPPLNSATEVEKAK